MRHPKAAALLGTHILIVEDDLGTNGLLRVLLEGSGCRVDCCFDGQAALAHLEREPYDGVILDLILPLISGLEILDKVGSRNPEALSRFLVVTASRQYGRLATSLNVPVILKPFDLDELLEKLAACAGRGPLGSSGARSARV